MKIGVIGIGNMGEPIAKNILASGYEVFVHNRTPEKVDNLISHGAKFLSSPGEVAKIADVIFTVLPNDYAINEVTFSENGLLNTMKKDNIHVSVGTISAETSKKLSASHSKNGQQFVSATVLGRPDAAINSEIQFIVSGPEPAQNKILPILDSISKNVFSIGTESYFSNIVKLGNNFLIMAMIEALSEVLVLIEKYDIDSKEFLKIVNTLFESPIYKNYSEIISNRNFNPPGFKLNLGLKDVNLMLEVAENISMSLPTANLVKKNYSECISEGWGNLDWSALINYIEKVNKYQS